MELEKGIEKVLIDHDDLVKRIAEMGKEISEDFKGEQLVVIGILKGVAYFMTNLTVSFTIPAEIDFVRASSYGSSTESSGKVKRDWDVQTDLKGKSVLLLDDIIDTGLTLLEIKKSIEAKGPKVVKVGVMLDKKERRKAPIEADYAGFVIPDHFVVGFGLDYDEQYRCLPYVGVLKPEVYEK